MIVIKQLTADNWRSFVGQPADVMVRQGGTKVWPKSMHPPIGLVIQDKNKRFYIQWQTGETGHWHRTIGEMIEQLHESISFFYIEINISR